ncbi:MAG: CHAP domain-containing protein [Rhodoglobus sp.]
MVDDQSSSDLDALLTFGVPATAPQQQFMSRRELREAESRAGKSAPVVAPVSRQAKAPSVRRTRKNPFSVLATMAVVGGLFAVAGLPAYALQTTEYASSTAITEADAQSVVVSSEAAVTTAVRDDYHATTPEQLAEMSSNALREANQAAYLASGARELGDDYPWPYELRDFQGGGLSPLNYYYRECVDFVAWRLNRDQGFYAAPFKWVWSTLTPNGGNGGQWMYNWQQKGWPVSKTPVVGAVAYTGGNHVAYVKTVNGDGTVTLEEYNYIPGKYGQRTIPASSVVAFLYPPT